MATRWTQKTFHKIHQMKTPEPKYLVGDLIEVTDDDWPYLKKGDTGIITYSRCDISPLLREVQNIQWNGFMLLTLLTETREEHESVILLRQHACKRKHAVV
jgi:hypothetical protein